jgi:hypothetical protein
MGHIKERAKFFLPLKTNSYFLGDAWFVQIFVQIDAGYEGVL